MNEDIKQLQQGPEGAKMKPVSNVEPDFRVATTSKRTPKAVADGVAGMLLANAEVCGTPDQTYRALMTSEVEKWWTIRGVYHLKDWKADLRVRGSWSVVVELNDGKQLNEWGEFCELDLPNKIVMSRRFGANPLLAERETTLTYRLEPSPHGTLVTLREEGFIGRPEAAYGNAEHWEKVLGWLDGYLSLKSVHLAGGSNSLSAVITDECKMARPKGSSSRNADQSNEQY